MRSQKKCWEILVSILGLMGLAFGQSHTPGPSKEDILQRWMTALGGEQRLTAVHVVYVKSHFVMGGLEGSYEQWDSDRGQHRDSINIPGAFQQDEVFDGQKGWVRDLSGTVHEISGSDLEDKITLAYQANFSWLLPGRMAGEVEFAGEDASHQFYVFKIAPRHGKPYTIFLDQQTFLPAREEQREGHATQVQYFSEWREVQGIKFPGRVRQSTGDPKYDGVMSLAQVEINPTLDTRLFAMPAETAAKARFTSGKDFAEFPFKLYGVDAMVPVRVNGKGPSWFIFDTGADVSAVVTERAKQLGFQSKGSIEGQGGGGSADVGIIPDVTLELPGVEIPTKILAEFPESGLSAIAGQPFQGVIGYDVISRFVVRLDYANKTIALYDPDKFHYSGSGAALPITFKNGNNLTVPGTINVPGRGPLNLVLTIDTGSSGSVDLNAPFVESNHLLQAIGKTIEGSSYGLGGRSTHLIGRLPSLQIGPYKINEPIVEMSRDTKGTEANPDRQGNVGGQVLSRFTIFLDYAHRQMILEPNEHLNDPFEYDMSGMRLVSNPPVFDKVIVDQLRADSPSEKAGMKKGDVIISVNGVPTSKYTLYEVKAMLRREGTVHLTVQREGKLRDVALVLRRAI